MSLLAIGLLAQPAVAQTINPNVVEFIPSAENNAVDASGQPIVSRYDMLFYQAGSPDAVLTISLGKPARQADGMMRVDINSKFGAYPLPNLSSEARVVAVGPAGSAVSNPSNMFTYACSPSLGTTSQSFGATGGIGQIQLSTATHCGWSATSSASWLTPSTSTGVGSAAVSYSVGTNTSSSARTATVTVAGLAYSVTQAGTTTSSSNQPPTIRITQPTAGTTLKSGPPQRIAADASDSDGTITSVDFYANGTLIKRMTTAPYTFKWKATVGSYVLTAVAHDNAGASATSAPVSVTAN